MPRTVWAKIRDPIPAPVAHVFAEAPIDAEVRSYLAPIPLVAAQIDRQVAELDRIIAARARASVTCRRLMTVPGVGPLVAWTFVSGVDQLERFRNARTVGAHFALTPKRHQSGELD